MAFTAAAISAMAIRNASVSDINADQMLVAAMAQKLAEPALYPRDALLSASRTFAFYIPAWMQMLRVLLSAVGQPIAAFQLLVPALVFGAVFSWFLLLNMVTRSMLAATIGTLSAFVPRDVPYEIWGFTGLGYALPRSLAHAILPLVVITALRAIASSERRWFAVLGLLAGLLINVHPPLGITCVPGLIAGILVGRRPSRASIAWLLAAFSIVMLPFLWAYFGTASFVPLRDPEFRSAVTNYYAFLRPVTWFSNPGNWKVWGFDWIGPVLLAGYGAWIGLCRSPDHRVRFLCAFAGGAIAFAVAGVLVEEVLLRVGVPVAEPQTIRGLRHAALPVFALAAFGVAAAEARIRRELSSSRQIVHGLFFAGLLVLLFAPPEPIRIVIHSRKAPPTDPAWRASRLQSVERAANWAAEHTPRDTLFFVSAMDYEDAALFRMVSKRSGTVADKDAFVFVHADAKQFLELYRVRQEVFRARATRRSGDIVGLALRMDADYLIAEHGLMPWLQVSFPVAYSDGSTTVYVLKDTAGRLAR